MALVLDHRQRLTLEQALAVGRGDVPAALADDTAAMLARRRAEVVEFVRRQHEPAYGFNRGFGHNVKLQVKNDDSLLEQLQLNLIRSHAMGLGEPAPREVVRTTMLLRAWSLSRGYSGVRPAVVEQLVALLNADIVPVVPRHGSVSASGDLCPLSHIALGLMGEGDVLVDGVQRPADEALSAAGIAPLSLQMKEGIALNNGVQYLTALGIICADELMRLLRVAALATALSSQVMLGSSSPFRADLHALRPHPGALAVAGWLRALLQDSPMQEVHRDKRVDGEVQDPYNLRCAAQILGTCYDLIEEARTAFEVEANSVTDNPLILAAGDGLYTDIVSGGHFHGMPVAVKVYNLMQAAAIMARLSNMRCARYVDEARNKGLGSDLIWPTLSDELRATSSGLMAAEYTSAALTNWIWGQTTPSHLFSVSTDAGQEDHVSMGAPLALRLLETLPRLAEVLAIELAFATQAAAIRKRVDHFPSKADIPDGVEQVRATFVEALERAAEREEGRPVGVEVAVRKLHRWSEAERRLSPPCERAYALLSRAFPAVTEDRCLAGDVAAIAELVRNGELLAAADLAKRG